MFETFWWTTTVLAVEWVIRLVMLCVIPFRRSPNAAKSWLLLVFFEPIVGLILFLLIGRTNLPKERQEMLGKLPEALAPTILRLRDSPRIFHPQPTGDLASITQLAKRLTGLEILGGNHVEVVGDYRTVLKRLAQDIDTAMHHVHLLFYIMAEDDWTEPVFAALERAVARGVEVRVMFDAYGSRAFRRKTLARLRKTNVPVYEALPIAFFRRKAARFDLRNHRKIAVVDGRIGWTGSLNLIDPGFKKGLVYEELMVRATGPIVLQLQYVFTSDWYLESEQALVEAVYYPEPLNTGQVDAQVLPSGPDFPGQGVHRMIVELVHAAQKRVIITTPYFVPDESLLIALTTAVLRGVEVCIMLSRTYDQLLVSLAQRSYYEELLDAGVKLYLYRPAFLHAKHLTIDDSLALVGSSNMDIRSFVLNSEISMICYSPEIVALIEREQQRYFQNADQLTLEEWEKRGFFSQFGESMARMVSPLL